MSCHATGGAQCGHGCRPLVQCTSRPQEQVQLLWQQVAHCQSKLHQGLPSATCWQPPRGLWLQWFWRPWGSHHRGSTLHWRPTRWGATGKMYLWKQSIKVFYCPVHWREGSSGFQYIHIKHWEVYAECDNFGKSNCPTLILVILSCTWGMVHDQHWTKFKGSHSIQKFFKVVQNVYILLLKILALYASHLP